MNGGATTPPGALAGLRVLELGDGVAASYATKLFADLGASVIKIEPRDGDSTRRHGPFPGGEPDPERSGLFLYLNANKDGIVLDLDRAADREAFLRLAAVSDLLIHDTPIGDLERVDLGWEALTATAPALVMTSIAPFGLVGPYAGYQATDLTLWAAGGIAYLNGGGPGTPDMPPLKAFGQQASFQGGVHAAVASMGALLARTRDRGRGQHVEVSIQECLASILELTFEQWPYAGVVSSRLLPRPIQPLAFFECRDGWIFVCCIEEHQWRQFVALMGDPAWADAGEFANRLSRGAHAPALHAALAPWIRERTVAELYHAAQARRIPFAPVSTMGDLVASPHLQARGFFAEITHPRAGALRYPGAPYRFGRTPWTLRKAAPCLGEDSARILATVGVDARTTATPRPGASAPAAAPR